MGEIIRTHTAETTINQVDIMLCDDQRWHFDAWGESDTKQVFRGSEATLYEALQTCAAKVKELQRG